MIKQTRIYLILVLALTLGLNLLPLKALAAGGSISLVANKATVSPGGSLIVAIYMNGGGNGVNAVQTDLNYPSSKLQYVGFSSSGSAFEISATNGSSDGVVNIARGTTSTVSGSGLVGTVTFKGLASSGSAAITIAGSSSLVVDGNAIPYGISNVSVNFGAATAAAPTSSAPAAAPVVEAPKDTTPPTITEVKIKDAQPSSAIIAWKTNEAADSVVEYGLDVKYGLGASVGTQTTAHEVTLNSTFLTPKTVFHYRVKSTDGSGNVQTGPDQTLPIPGIAVTITVRSADGQPQPGAMVTLDNQTGITDDHGKVTLPSGSGNKTIITSFNGVTLQKTVTINKDAKTLPSYQLALNRAPANRWMYSSAGLAFVVILLLGVDSVVFGSKIFAKLFRVRLHRPAFVHHEQAVAAPAAVVAEEPVQAAAAPITELVTAPKPRYTTIRPHDLDGDLDLHAAANVPLAQLVNNVPKPSDNPVTKIAISHFGEDEPVTVAEPIVQEVPKKPAAPKKVTRRVKKPTAKLAKATKVKVKAS